MYKVQLNLHWNEWKLNVNLSKHQNCAILNFLPFDFEKVKSKAFEYFRRLLDRRQTFLYIFSQHNNRTLAKWRRFNWLVLNRFFKISFRIISLLETFNDISCATKTKRIFSSQNSKIKTQISKHKNNKTKIFINSKKIVLYSQVFVQEFSFVFLFLVRTCW